MDRRFGYSLFYVFLLLTITPAMCRRRAKTGQSEKKSERRRRYAAVLLPTLAEITGVTLAPWLFVALVAVYGITGVRNLSIQEHTNEDVCYSNPCANNRGWCRDPCFSHEKPVWWKSDVCGGGCPCCVNEDVYNDLHNDHGKK